METSSADAEATFRIIRSRRAVRQFTDKPVSVTDLRQILTAARWASSGGNRRLHRFLVSRDPLKIELISKIGPGFFGTPTAIIAILTDLAVCAEEEVPVGDDSVVLIDVGTASMNMQLAAHALGLGTTPVTSFSKSGASVVLDLPDHLRPEMIMQVGHPLQQDPSSPRRRGKRIQIEDLSYWESIDGDFPKS